MIQRSSISPKLLQPKRAISGRPVSLIACISDSRGNCINNWDILRDYRVTATIPEQGPQPIELIYDGDPSNGDVQARDGRYTAIVTFDRSGNFIIKIELWLNLKKIVISLPFQERNQGVPVSSWIQYHAWWVGMIGAFALVGLIITGFVTPMRFDKKLALAFAPEQAELSSPWLINSGKGVKIGFFRNAKAYLHPNYGIYDKAKGALVSLEAVKKNQVCVRPGVNTKLYVETYDQDWEQIPPEGAFLKMRTTYRVDDRGPYFSATKQSS